MRLPRRSFAEPEISGPAPSVTSGWLDQAGSRMVPGNPAQRRVRKVRGRGPAGFRRRWRLGAVGIAFWLAPCAYPHGDVHLQITELTQQIQQTPSDPSLYIRRGELFRIHRLWDAALADFETVRSLEDPPATLDLHFGRLYVEAGWPETGHAVLTRFLKRHPDHSEAYVLRAQALMQLDRPLEAEEDFSTAIATVGRPRPELFIQRAEALARAGPEHYGAALEGLDAGIASLGPLVTLQLPAIELELKRKAYDQALRRLETIAAQSPRKESWLKRRGEILLQAGRTEEAIRAFEQSLQALEKLPPARRNVPAMLDLKKELTLQLEQLAPNS